MFSIFPQITNAQRKEMYSQANYNQKRKPFVTLSDLIQKPKISRINVEKKNNQHISQVFQKQKTNLGVSQSLMMKPLNENKTFLIERKDKIITEEPKLSNKQPVSLPKIVDNNKIIAPKKLDPITESNHTLSNNSPILNSSMESTMPFTSSEISNKKIAFVNDKSWKQKLLSIQHESMEALASTIKQFANDEIEKAWCLFYWITHNIEYDARSYFSGNFGDNSSEGVFRSKKSVCEGYATLFKSLSNLLGIECIKIGGYAKGHGYKIGDDVSKNNHAWNAVKIRNQWYLIDSTWGAGNLDGQQFKFKFNAFYFLTPPEYFIYGHLPTNQKFQYLKASWSQEKFKNMIYPTEKFFENEIKLISPLKSIIFAKNETSVEMKFPTNVEILVKLIINDKEIENATSIIKKEESTMIIARLPSNGEYLLDIYSLKSDGSFKIKKIFTQTLSFKIIAT